MINSQLSSDFASSAGYKVVFGFDGIGGREPNGLTVLNGTLYGTTQGGAHNFGTVFSVTPAGKEAVLHSFRSGFDGAHPLAGLTNENGVLYGTTSEGGAERSGYSYGTVFTITASGEEHVLYRFKGDSGDGQHPFAGLVRAYGRLYGTTAIGGANRYGTVFSVTPAGDEKVIHSFGSDCASYCTDGADPRAGLVYVNGTLYGTTYQGGKDNFGTVFSVTPAGDEKGALQFPRRARPLPIPRRRCVSHGRPDRPKWSVLRHDLRMRRDRMRLRHR